MGLGMGTFLFLLRGAITSIADPQKRGRLLPENLAKKVEKVRRGSAGGWSGEAEREVSVERGVVASFAGNRLASRG
jgi:hypothetical protein